MPESYKHFHHLSMIQKHVLLIHFGEYISTIDLLDTRVKLYILDNFFVEVFLNKHNENVELIKF